MDFYLNNVITIRIDEFLNINVALFEGTVNFADVFVRNSN